MQELLNKIYQEKLDDGTIEKIISDELEESVRESIRSVLGGYNSKFRKEIEKKLESIIDDVLEHSDFQKYIDKLTYLVNKGIPDSKLSCIDDFEEAIKSAFGKKEKIPSEITVEDLFAHYTHFVEAHPPYESDVDDLIKEDAGDKWLDIECGVNYKEEYGESATLTFWAKIPDADDADVSDWQNDVRVNVHLYKGKISSWQLDFKVRELRFMGEFKMMLIRLANADTKIIVNKKTIKADLCVDYND